MADWCVGKNIPLQLAHAKMLKTISYAKVKTDSMDARTLVDLLRVAFNQASIIAYTHYPAVKEFYKKSTRRSGKHVARTVVSKELAKIVWHMLAREEEYKGFKGRMTRVITKTTGHYP